MKEKKYCAVFVERLANQDFEDKGYLAKPTCTMAQDCNIKSDSLTGLLGKISDEYGYYGDCWFVPEGGGSVSFNRHEDANGTPLSEREIRDHWRKNKPVYLCNYTFWIEYQVVRSAHEGELRDAVVRAGANLS